MPVQCDHALDSGCGTGVFARKLARHARFVEAVDKAADVVADACRQSIGTRTSLTSRQIFPTTTSAPPGTSSSRAWRASTTCRSPRPSRGCAMHWCPEACSRCWAATATATLADYLHDVVAVPANLAARAGVGMAAVLHGDRGIESATAPISEPQMSLLEVRAEASRLLPGSETRRWLVWRYTLVYRRRERVGDDAYPGPHGFRD